MSSLSEEESRSLHIGIASFVLVEATCAWLVDEDKVPKREGHGESKRSCDIMLVRNCGSGLSWWCWTGRAREFVAMVEAHTYRERIAML